MAFSQPHADAALNFIERILRHTADEYYGKPFVLAPWQEEMVSKVFGTVDDAGNRVIQTVYCEVVKKSGKTELASALVLLVLLLTPTKSTQVYGAAAATRQAMNVYRACCKMVEQSPLLQKRLRVLRGTNRIVRRDDPDSFYAAVAADGDFGDGVNPSCVIADEVHRWKTRKQMENWDVLSNGGITRRQTLTIAITTAGVQTESPIAWRLHEKTRRIQEGIVEDPTFFGRIYAADPKDPRCQTIVVGSDGVERAEFDPGKPETWIMANPSLKENGGFLDIEKVRQKYESAVAEGDLTSFKRYFLNIWDQKENRCIDMQQWNASGGDWTARGLLAKQPEQAVRTFPHEFLTKFFGRRCWVGIDLSMTEDLTAVSFVFPRDDEEEEAYDILPFYWTPSNKLKQREIRDGVPYRQWAAEGYLEVSEGNVIDYREIRARLDWGEEMFDVQEHCFDRYNSRQISVMMIDSGFQCKEIQQGFVTLNEPSKKLLTLVAQGRLYHGGHPMLKWNASCLSAKFQNDLLMFEKPDRAKSSSRIDGISATIDALSEAILAPRANDRSPALVL